ncbi:LiaF domain-containing protein [Ornithinimicrobium avium]|uniref:Uncharacterized protein n=1 Tax=Ornithinimicrobium avium TaxID=2283195 RepID=A0A345NNG1_9MICO|nr:LiaF domain-containing protein [Ornithinimicrobium avium]AXH96569.1 hypothetical protein DV701_10940 [Ornithinimicrobium avium]
MTSTGGGAGAGPEQWRGPSEIGDEQTVGPPPPLPDPNVPGQGLPEIVPDAATPLPAYRGTPAPPPARREKSDPFFALIGDVTRTGRWPAARRTTALSAIGDVRLDLREVLQPGETLEIEAWSLIGNLAVVVPPGTEVSVEGGALMGGFKQTNDADPATPRTGARLILKAYLLIGDIKVREAGPDSGKPPRGWRWSARS